MQKIIIRPCSVCGSKIKILLEPDGKYSGGHYFGKMTVKKEKFEYWECNKCYEK